MLLFRVELPLVVALFTDVPIQIALLVVQLLVGLAQARAVALERALVALQLAEVAFELRRVLRGQIVADGLPVTLNALLGALHVLAIVVHSLSSLVHRIHVAADVLTILLDFVVQMARAGRRRRSG
jgi:hypothetical protein